MAAAVQFMSSIIILHLLPESQRDIAARLKAKECIDNMFIIKLIIHYTSRHPLLTTQPPTITSSYPRS
jgi:hypothetical protein